MEKMTICKATALGYMDKFTGAPTATVGQEISFVASSRGYNSEIFRLPIESHANGEYMEWGGAEYHKFIDEGSDANPNAYREWAEVYVVTECDGCDYCED